MHLILTKGGENLAQKQNKAQSKTEKWQFVKEKFSGPKMGIVKIAEGEKVGKKSKKVENNYVNNAGILPYFFIKKRPVEKAVESVEKSILSTKKPGERPKERRRKTPFFEKNAV